MPLHYSLGNNSETLSEKKDYTGRGNWVTGWVSQEGQEENEPKAKHCLLFIQCQATGVGKESAQCSPGGHEGCPKIGTQGDRQMGQPVMLDWGAILGL